MRAVNLLPVEPKRTRKAPSGVAQIALVAPFVVAGLLDDATAFYGIDPGEQRWPVIMSVGAATAAFGPAAAPGSALVRTRPGTDLAGLRASLQGSLLGNGVVVTDLRQRVESSYTANQQLFRLMQGYLALGLLVGITGLGVLTSIGLGTSLMVFFAVAAGAASTLEVGAGLFDPRDAGRMVAGVEVVELAPVG